MKRNFKLRYNPQIHEDIQKTVSFYRRETGNNELGKRFVTTVKTELKKLKHSALHYQIRYDDIRLLPIPAFSFMAHYKVDKENNLVEIEAIIHTSKDPVRWKDRT